MKHRKTDRKLPTRFRVRKRRVHHSAAPREGHAVRFTAQASARPPSPSSAPRPTPIREGTPPRPPHGGRKLECAVEFAASDFPLLKNSQNVAARCPSHRESVDRAVAHRGGGEFEQWGGGRSFQWFEGRPGRPHYPRLSTAANPFGSPFRPQAPRWRPGRSPLPRWFVLPPG